MIGGFFTWKRAASAALFLFCAVLHAREPGVASRFMVAAAHPMAAGAGVEILKRGGSAVDAAIAVQAMLGLVEPESSGIGGGAFLLHWSAGERKLRTYDGRETAPAAARPDRFLREGRPMGFLEAAVGGQSVGVPGVLRMLELAHERRGRLPWSTLFDAAIRAAEEGFPMSARLHEALADEQHLQSGYPARALFYAGGAPKPVGSRLVNREYAATLREIARGGARVFYEGDIARDMVLTVRAHAKSGDLSEADLAGYRAIEREPVCGPYRRWRVCSMGPPSSGGVAVLQILGLLERTQFARAPPHGAEAVHYFSEAGRLAFADRARYAGDPDLLAVPVAKLLDGRYLDARARLIGERSMRFATPGDTEAPGTSHLSIVEENGDAVSMTTTIESTFGSRVMVRGFLLNNQLTDFDFVPGGPNEVRGGKRPRSSMAPALVFDAGGALHAVVGSPGGPNIIGYVARVLVATLDWRLPMQQAIAAPNFGSRNGPTLVEAGTPYEALMERLGARGHDVRAAPLRSGLHGIERIPGGWRGGADPRRDGVVLGE